MQTLTILKNAAEEASTDFFTQLMFSGVFSGANREILVYLVCVIIINNRQINQPLIFFIAITYSGSCVLCSL